MNGKRCEVRDKQAFVRAYLQRSFQPTEGSAIPYTALTGLGVLMFFRQKNESLANKSKLLSKRQLTLVPTVNESGSSFRFPFPKFVLDLHLPSKILFTPLIKS